MCQTVIGRIEIRAEITMSLVITAEHEARIQDRTGQGEADHPYAMCGARVKFP